MTTPQLTDEQRLFESAHCGNNRDTVRKNSTTGEYVLPSINDAWAGFQTARALLAQPAAAPPAPGGDVLRKAAEKVL